MSGTSDDVAAGLREVIDAGAAMILLNPVGLTWQRIASRWNALPQKSFRSCAELPYRLAD